MRTFVSLALILAFVSPAFSQEKKKGQMDEDVKKATAKALEWIASKQNSDGSWGDTRYPNNTAITGFAMMALMSQGHVPNQGKYGPEVAKGCRFLLASPPDSDGYLIGRGRGHMYFHGMATLASARCSATGDENVKKTLKRAIDLIVRCRRPGRRLAVRAAADRVRHLWSRSYAGDGLSAGPRTAASTSRTGR